MRNNWDMITAIAEHINGLFKNKNHSAKLKKNPHLKDYTFSVFIMSTFFSCTAKTDTHSVLNVHYMSSVYVTQDVCWAQTTIIFLFLLRDQFLKCWYLRELKVYIPTKSECLISHSLTWSIHWSCFNYVEYESSYKMCVSARHRENSKHRGLKAHKCELLHRLHWKWLLESTLQRPPWE